jgi:hypothetical protein
LILRILEHQGKDISSITKHIVKNHDIQGLHIVHFIENGLFSIYLGLIMQITNEDRLQYEIKELFENIDQSTMFVKSEDVPNIKGIEIITKIHSYSPNIFIISAIGDAIKISEKIIFEITPKLNDYTIIKMYKEEWQRIYFLVTTPQHSCWGF